MLNGYALLGVYLQMQSRMQAALGVAVDETLQLGMDWIWARIQELASLLRSLLAGGLPPATSSCLAAGCTASAALHSPASFTPTCLSSFAAQEGERCRGPVLLQPSCFGHMAIG